MSNMREAVQEAFESFRGTVDETVQSMKGKVGETVSTVSENLDLAGMVERHPWLCIGGFVALGYLGYKLLGASADQRIVEGMSAAGSAGPGGMAGAEGERASRSPGDHRHGNGRHRQTGAAEPSGGQESTQQQGGGTYSAGDWSRVMDEMKALAIGVPLSILRDRLAEQGAEIFRSQVVELMNFVTEKLGGKVVHPHESHA